MRWLLALGAFGMVLQGQELPGWWKGMLELPRLECRFRQESESAIFGSLRKEGRLQLSRGGKIRVTYAEGLLIVSDGKTLIQYDPGARTAQRLALRSAAAEMPLLNVLLDPRALESVYHTRALASGGLILESRKPGLPKVELEGKGAFLGKITWVDATGAKQVLEILEPRIPKSIPDSAYKLRVPEGTRWLEIH